MPPHDATYRIFIALMHRYCVLCGRRVVNVVRHMAKRHEIPEERYLDVIRHVMRENSDSPHVDFDYAIRIDTNVDKVENDAYLFMSGMLLERPLLTREQHQALLERYVELLGWDDIEPDISMTGHLNRRKTFDKSCEGQAIEPLRWSSHISEVYGKRSAEIDRLPSAKRLREEDLRRMRERDEAEMLNSNSWGSAPSWLSTDPI